MFHEQEALLKLKHTGSVPLLYGIYTLDEETDQSWMIMEDCGTQVDMNSVHTRYVCTTQVSTQHVLMHPFAYNRTATFEAYQAIHEANILHRDVAPRHVLSADGGQTVKIIDWEDAHIGEDVGEWIYGCGLIDEEATINAMTGYV
jgi:serine/threonine protein kinase